MRIFPDFDGSSAISKWLSCGAIDELNASTSERIRCKNESQISNDYSELH